MKLGALGYRILGGVALALGTAGVFLPVLPTTPFVLLAAWAFARGSPELHRRLTAHPRFGPLLRDWEEHGAISRRSKVVAVLTMAAGLAFSAWMLKRPIAVAALAAILACSAAFVISRPSPPKPGAD